MSGVHDLFQQVSSLPKSNFEHCLGLDSSTCLLLPPPPPPSIISCLLLLLLPPFLPPVS